MILVTGASGGLGGLILDRLDGSEDVQVAAGTRTPAGVARRIDFDEPATLVEGFADVDVLVFISAGFAEDDVVRARHGAAIDAAAAKGIRHVIYTSLSGSGDHLTTALAHRWTEGRLAEAPFDFTVLRNGLYAELPAEFALSSVEPVAATGMFHAPLGTGRMAVVAREDLADVAVRVAVEVQADLARADAGRHAGRTYELGGVTAVGGDEIAAALATALGRRVEYQDVPLAAVRAALSDSGLEPYRVGHTISLLSNVSAGVLEPRASDLPELLDGAPRDVTDLITDAVRSATSSVAG
jgi:NAD(P)H dehydrogenase (quinone)